MSKYITLLLSVSIIVALTALLSYVLSGLIFGYHGWNAPVITGFGVNGGEVDISQVQMVGQWKLLLMDMGLVWLVAVVVGTLSFMLSVLIRSTPAGMGIMLAALISGAILSNMVSSWESAKYFFMVNLKLTSYVSGVAPPIEGMSLSSSVLTLLVWWTLALIVSFIVFTRRDVY